MRALLACLLAACAAVAAGAFMATAAQAQSTIEARVGGESVPRTYRAQLARGRARRLAIDTKRPRSIAAWHASIQMVLFHPGDVALAGGPPAPDPRGGRVARRTSSERATRTTPH